MKLQYYVPFKASKDNGIRSVPMFQILSESDISIRISSICCYAVLLRTTYCTVNICTLILMFLLCRAVQSKTGMPPPPPSFYDRQMNGLH
jgi:hypothetical protein